MSRRADRPEQPEPFLRGAAFRAARGVPYPRARDDARLPRDTWAQACIPAGVRLEFDGTAEVVSIQYRTATDDTGFRGDGGGRTFQLWSGNQLVAEEPAVLGDGIVELATGGHTHSGTVYLPEVMRPTILSIQPVGGEIRPRSAPFTWAAYGDSILEGWSASCPARGWAARVAREYELNLIANMGYAGSARGELASAEHLASRVADVYSISHGTNCWSVVPHSVEMMRASMNAFLDLLRRERPETPVVVLSPVVRPDAERMPNLLGATLADLRSAMEQVARERIAAGDAHLTLVPGLEVLHDTREPGGMLADGIHPNDAGHAAIANALGEPLRDVAEQHEIDSCQAAEAEHIAREGTG